MLRSTRLEMLYIEPIWISTHKYRHHMRHTYHAIGTIFLIDDSYLWAQKGCPASVLLPVHEGHATGQHIIDCSMGRIESFGRNK